MGNTLQVPLSHRILHLISHHAIQRSAIQAFAPGPVLDSPPPPASIMKRFFSCLSSATFNWSYFSSDRTIYSSYKDMIAFGHISTGICINMYMYESTGIFVLRIKKNGIII